MSLITVILFFVYTWGLGFSITYFIKNPENFFERNIMRIGIGLGVSIFLIALLGILKIPIDWKILLVLSIIIPLYGLYKNIRNKNLKFDLKLTKTNISIFGAIILFIFALYMYTSGAFAYPYFEDDDPWEHAKSVKYVAMEKTLYEPAYADKDIFGYLDPRPPAYDSLMAILHQTSPSLMWTMKFFNSLFISLGILFFYFFVKKFTQSKNKALFASLVLVMIPSFLSHFIWSHALIPTLFFVAFYCLEMMREDKKWLAPTSLVISAIFLTQETQSVKFMGLFFIYWIVHTVLEKRILYKEILAPIFGAILSGIVWWFPALFKFGSVRDLMRNSYGVESVLAKTAFSLHPSIKKVYFGSLGSGTAQHGIYTFKDFFIATSSNMINNPLGIGMAVSLLTIFGLVFLYVKRKTHKQKPYLLITLLWLIFTFLGIHGGTHWWSPIALIPFRFWMLFSIPVAILAAEGAFLLASLGKSLKINKTIILLALVVAVFFTAGQQKYQLNTMQWSPGGSWASQEELQAFLWLKNLPPDTRVITYSGRGDKFAMSFGTFTCIWCEDYLNFRKNLLEKSATEIHTFMKRQNYKYFILDARSYKYLGKQFNERYGVNQTKDMIDSQLVEIQGSDLFNVAFSNQGATILTLA